MNPKDLQRLVTEVLKMLGLYSHSSLWQLMGTAAVESRVGRDLYQHPHGPGRGPFQIEPRTELWLCRWVQTHRHFRKVLSSFVPKLPGGELALAGNIPYGICLCRLRYWVVPKPLPSNLEGWAWYWDTYYNANDIDERSKFIERFKRYFGPEQ